MSGELPSDDKIRIRCPQCGKRLKFPASQAGKIFNCPICSTVVVAPLGDHVAASGPAQTPAEEKTPPVAEALPKIAGWQAQRREVERNRAIEKLTNFLSRENLRVGQACQDLIMGEPPNVDAATLARKFHAIRVERGQRLQEFVQNLCRELDGEIQKLRDHPMSHQARIQSELERLRRERRDLDIFLRVMIRGEPPPAPAGIAPASSPPSPQQ